MCVDMGYPPFLFGTDDGTVTGGKAKSPEKVLRFF
jgi:hypothetical protein